MHRGSNGGSHAQSHKSIGEIAHLEPRKLPVMTAKFVDKCLPSPSTAFAFQTPMSKPFPNFKSRSMLIYTCSFDFSSCSRMLDKGIGKTLAPKYIATNSWQILIFYIH